MTIYGLLCFVFILVLACILRLVLSGKNKAHFLLSALLLFGATGSIMMMIPDQKEEIFLNVSYLGILILLGSMGVALPLLFSSIHTALRAMMPVSPSVTEAEEILGEADDKEKRAEITYREALKALVELNEKRAFLKTARDRFLDAIALFEEAKERFYQDVSAQKEYEMAVVVYLLQDLEVRGLYLDNLTISEFDVQDSRDQARFKDLARKGNRAACLIEDKHESSSREEGIAYLVRQIRGLLG